MGDRESRDIIKAMDRQATPKKKDSQNDEQEVEDVTADLENLNTNGAFDTMHPVYRAISSTNGKVNRMDLSQLKHHCKKYNLSTFGKREAIRRRLKEYLKVEKLIEAGLMERKESLIQNADFFIVIDFEATCEEKNPTDYPHEIIEFPAVLVSTEKKEIVDVFHSFVRPVINPRLSEFCCELTGIEQSTVDAASEFSEVHDRFLRWMDQHGLGIRHTYTIVTDGPFDMGRFLFLQTKQSEMEYPLSYASHWTNLRKCFANFYKRGGGEVFVPVVGPPSTKLPGLQQMLDMLGLKFEGSPHSGVDDAKNIARILIKLLEDRAFVRVNERVVNVSGNHQDDRGGGRLSNVCPVTRKEAEKLLNEQRKKVGKQPS